MNGRTRAELWTLDAVFLFVLIIWCIQLFLVISGLDAFLGEEQHGILWPAALTSIALALVNLKLVSLIKE